MSVITTQAVKDNENVAENSVLKVALLMSGASVFPSVVAVIPHLFVPWLKVFQTDVALSHSNELFWLFGVRGSIGFWGNIWLSFLASSSR